LVCYKEGCGPPRPGALVPPGPVDYNA
jgi:hypothetical protein